MTEIKPCPDGHKTVDCREWPAHGPDKWHWFGRCTCCGWRGPSGRTQAEAIAAWNTRTPDPSLLNGLREAREALAEVLSYRHGEGKYRFASLPEAERECAAFDAWQEIEAMAETTRAKLDTLLSEGGQ